MEVIKEIWVQVGEPRAKALKAIPLQQSSPHKPNFHFHISEAMPGTRAALFSAETFRARLSWWGAALTPPQAADPVPEPGSGNTEAFLWWTSC